LEYAEIDLNHLLNVLRKQKQKTPKSLCNHINYIRVYWQQMLSAVNTIHNNRIVHGDLKPANFVCREGYLKLIDFGIAEAIASDTTNITREHQMGTANYISPEALTLPNIPNAKIKCGRASDIWSLGCILYEMVYGRPPFYQHNLVQKVKYICDPNYHIDIQPLENYPILTSVLQNCLQRNPQQRPTIPHLLQLHF